MKHCDEKKLYKQDGKRIYKLARKIYAEYAACRGSAFFLSTNVSEEIVRKEALRAIQAAEAFYLEKRTHQESELGKRHD